MIRTLLLGAFAFLVPPLADAATISESATGMAASVFPDGEYLINVQSHAWVFGGAIGRQLEQVRQGAGTDGIGKYDEITFQFGDGGTPKRGAIRLYRQRPIVLFTLTFLAAGANRGTFPDLVRYPAELYHLTNTGWEQHFDERTTDGPLVEFDNEARTFILSPASNFMIAGTSLEPGEMTSGISPKIQSLPAGFIHRTLLVVDKGINQGFETWGHALSDLQGKVRPANDADLTLSRLGYWTDNGASYYYKFEDKLGYEKTLLAIRDEFHSKGIPLGYLQLDSWFYPKGAMASWKNRADGIYEYEASPTLFPEGLKQFQEKAGLPLVTHARWIDPSSPYQREYRMSNDVVIDPRYWDTTMSYLRESGVATYEQDWLTVHAQAKFDLSDPSAFLAEMAQAAAKKGLTLQYCMPGARHYLQSSKYSNMTTIRTSPDRFSRHWWDRFLYGSRLAR